MDTAPTEIRVVNLRSLIFWGLAVYLIFRFIDAIALTVLLFVVAFFFAIVLDSPIRWLDRRGLSRGMSVSIIVLAVLMGIGLAAYFAVPPLVHEIGDLAKNAPRYAQNVQRRVEELVADYPALRQRIAEADIAKGLSTVGQHILPQLGRFSLSFLGGLFSLLLVFVIMLYTIAQPKPLVRGVIMALPKSTRKTTLRVLLGITQQVQAWVRATFWLMVIIGLSCGLGLWALGVKSALLFGIIAGIGEAIPTIGPILSAIPPTIVAFADNPMKALHVIILFLVVQQVENHFLVPRIMAST
ncbi:MAG TPA: AI-2E family transporter, partial [Chthonomonadales bacterium]|nr:AI-2E family transporter [Chthonomonadales bacterium]